MDINQIAVGDEVKSRLIIDKRGDGFCFPRVRVVAQADAVDTGEGERHFFLVRDAQGTIVPVWADSIFYHEEWR